ncbi:MAG: M48 family metalloprotease [Candidatus Babeliales bacterium]
MNIRYISVHLLSLLAMATMSPPLSSMASKILPHVLPLSVSCAPLAIRAFSNQLRDGFENYHKQHNPERYAELMHEKDVMQSFLHKELKSNGIPNAESIAVQLTNIEPFLSSIHNKILIGVEFRERFIKAGILHAPLSTTTYRNENGDKKVIEEWYTGTQEESKKYYQQVLAALWHEVGHIHAYHDASRLVTFVAMPLSIYTACVGILKRMPIPLRGPKHTLVYACTAVPMYGISRIIGNLYSRHQERYADEYIPNKDEYLQGAIDLFEQRIAEQPTKNLNNGSLLSKYGEAFSYYWHATHPTDQERLARFKERLALLEEQTSN